MIALKAIQSSSFPSTQHPFLHTRSFFKNISTLSLCKPSNSDADSDLDPPKPEGDTRQQDILAQIAMLQAQKVRLTDYLDERSAYLTQFAEEANVEFDEIGENALKQLDEAGTRIMENLESQMQAFEESSELSKLEIEKNENILAEFESQIEEERNEGLFFKNLKQRTPEEKEKAKEETKKIKEVTNENAGVKARQNIYLALIGLMTIGIVNALMSPSDWKKVATFGAILLGLILQLIYEQKLASETKGTETVKNEEEKD